MQISCTSLFGLLYGGSLDIKWIGFSTSHRHSSGANPVNAPSNSTGIFMDGCKNRGP